MELLDLTSANLTNSTGPPAQFLWSARALVPAIILSVCFLVGFPGNVAVLILRPNWQQLSTLTQSLMVNLALSDLLCLVTLPVWIYTLLYSWTLGLVTCKILAYLVHCSINTSLLTVTALSVQRYVQVVHPLRCLHFKKKRLVVLMWLVSMVLSTPALVIRKTRRHQDIVICLPVFTSSAQQVAVLLIEVLVAFCSLTMTTCAYVLLIRKLNQALYFNNTSPLKLVTAIIVTYFGLWMPYLVFDLVIVAGILSNNLKIVAFYDHGFKVFATVTFLNSAVNPLIYAFANGICCKVRELQTARTMGTSQQQQQLNKRSDEVP